MANEVDSQRQLQWTLALLPLESSVWLLELAASGDAPSVDEIRERIHLPFDLMKQFLLRALPDSEERHDALVLLRIASEKARDAAMFAKENERE